MKREEREEKEAYEHIWATPLSVPSSRRDGEASLMESMFVA